MKTFEELSREYGILKSGEEYLVTSTKIKSITHDDAMDLSYRLEELGNMNPSTLSNGSHHDPVIFVVFGRGGDCLGLAGRIMGAARRADEQLTAMFMMYHEIWGLSNDGFSDLGTMERALYGNMSEGD